MSDPGFARMKGKAMSKVSRGFLAIGVLAVLAFGMPAARAEEVALSTCAETQDFTPDVDNRYFPLEPGQVSTFFGVDQGERIGLRISVSTGPTETFYEGADDELETIAVHELEWFDSNRDGSEEGDELIESSTNWFAQVSSGANRGTVCYFGETVDIYDENGQVVSHEGSWRADNLDNLPGLSPGVFMPAVPAKGQSFQTENAPPDALDTATVTKILKSATVPAGQFQEVLKVRDCSGDGSCGTKYYAPEIGLILDNSVKLTDLDSGD